MKFGFQITLSSTMVSSQTGSVLSGGSSESVWLWGDSTELQWGDGSFIRIF